MLVVGLGKREEVDAERLRLAAAVAAKQAGKLEAASLAWLLPESDDDEATADAIVTGTILADYRFDRLKSSEPADPPAPRIESLTLVGREERRRGRRGGAHLRRGPEPRPRPAEPAVEHRHALLSGPPRRGARRAAPEAQRRGDRPRGDRRQGDGRHRRRQPGQRRGAEADRAALRGRRLGPTLGLVGKGVTFDTGGISLKPSASMHEMKMDMSGAAAVLEAVGAIAELGLPVNLIAVVPATENMPSGTAIKPGDVITMYSGKTVEVNNTDAEGRLILADALAYAVELGAERIVDLATLTGAVLMALGSTYAAVISNDDGLAGELAQAGETTGELVWRLPLHQEYKDLVKGTVGDLTNAAAKRKAGTIYAGSFLEEFVGETPWAHVDIAGTAWDVGRPYTGNDASGFGVRLLVELARELKD